MPFGPFAGSAWYNSFIAVWLSVVPTTLTNHYDFSAIGPNMSYEQMNLCVLKIICSIYIYMNLAYFAKVTNFMKLLVLSKLESFRKFTCLIGTPLDYKINSFPYLSQEHYT